MTILVCFILASYATIKLIQVLSKSNPNVSQFVDEMHYDYSERVNLSDIDFQIAFTVEGYFDKKQRNDPRYVKYMARLRGTEDGVSYER